MKPNKNTVFVPLSDINEFSDKKKYFCSAVVFSPETENNHFEGCPPYIAICKYDYFSNKSYLYFEVPEIIAYYTKTHPCYTMKGRENHIKQGEKNFKNKFKEFLDI